MDLLTRFTSIAAPFDVPDIDTDRITPARFLRKPRDSGYGAYLFHDLRQSQTDFVLDREVYRDARILVAASNFGCGSSREQAVWALIDRTSTYRWFRAIIAPSFGEIFQNNALNNGLLVVQLPEPVVSALMRRLEREPGAQVTVDLATQLVIGPDGDEHRFEIDPFRRDLLVRGVDEIGFALGYEAEISAAEAALARAMPWVGDPGGDGGGDGGGGAEGAP